MRRPKKSCQLIFSEEGGDKGKATVYKLNVIFVLTVIATGSAALLH